MVLSMKQSQQKQLERI